MWRMSSDLDTERLSSLPKHIIETILMCMPIRDAVRTSVLSRSWQYEWTTLPQLTIDRASFENLEGTTQLEMNRKIAKAVNTILLLHHGPIQKFTLSVDLESCADIGRWIRCLSRNGIKEFTQDKWHGEINKPPSCFFSCVDVTYLELSGCAFIPPTSSKGFSRLTAMDLQCVSFTDNGFATLLSVCPLLNDLESIDITDLKVSAQKLVNITVEGAFDDIQFESMPLLATASFEMEVAGDHSLVASQDDCKIVKFLGEIPSIYQLELTGHTFRNLAVGDVPVHLPAICLVKYLLININFEDMQEMLAAFCIFRSSLIMQKLHVAANSNKSIARISSEKFWEGEESFSCAFNQLKVVKVIDFSGIASELKFIEFVLANAPVLERLNIKFQEDVADLVEILKSLSGYRRISPKARVFFLD